MPLKAHTGSLPTLVLKHAREHTRTEQSTMHSEETTISCHEREIPSFVESELEQLYENIHCSLAFFRQFRALENVSTYIVRKGAQTTTLFLFRCENRKVTVLNEMIRIDEEEIHRFANYVFARFSSIAVISFQAIQTTVGRLPFPCQKCIETEDFSMRLPATTDEYTASLGKATRDYIKRYSRKILRTYPSFACTFRSGSDVDEQTIRDIIDMCKTRMESKKKKFALNEGEAKALIRLARVCGFIHAARINGRLCAGSLSYRIGSNHFVFVIAHDAEFDHFRPGTLCYYFTICESILLGAKHFHMGRGWYEYKRRLLGVRQEFDRLLIYRSYRHMALHCDSVVKTACIGYVRRLKLWLLHPQHQNSFISRFTVNLLHALRNLKANK
jgi:hypothetical protein